MASEKRKEIFDSIWNQLEADEKNVVVMNHLKSLSTWDKKRVLCSVFDIDYMNDDAIRDVCKQLINAR